MVIDLILKYIINNEGIYSVTADFRDLGNWIHNEEDAYYREEEGDMDWREDDDNQIWAPGEYKKYFNKFNDWAKRYSWYKYVKLELSTSEKNYCEFSIKINKV